jgi:ADP-ribose pyrophosphatase YjhB (NUDIX family)
MKLLLTLKEQDIDPSAASVNPTDFSHRRAARAVVSNDQGEIGLLKVGNHNYHKLPGGGVEAGEDMQKALRRELLEEIGYEATVTAEVGEIVEYRDKWSLKQTSNCYLAKQIGQQQPPAFTEKELDDGFEIVWAPSIDGAIVLLEQDEPANYDGQFIKRRDLAFLEAAKLLVDRPKLP